MFKLKYRLQDEVNPEGGEGGGAAETFTKEQVQAMIEAETKKVSEALQKEKDALLSKNSELIGERRKDQERIAREQARATGELDKFEESLRGEFNKEREGLTAKLDALTQRVTGESKKAVLSSFASEFHAPESLDLVAQLVNTEFDGTDVKTQFTDFAGNVITTDPAEFKKWMQQHPAISHLMKADAASGGGANGSRGANGVSNTMSRSNFDKLNPTAKQQFIAKGGTLTE